MSEKALIKDIILAASKNGARLFRNNLGQLKTPDGRIIRYGLCNPGGSDLIGWKPIIIEPHHIGRRLSVFVAIEAKFGNTATSEKQQNFIHQVRISGGVGVIARCVEDVLLHLGEAE